MDTLTLYGTPGCHLCEAASKLIGACGISARPVDISGDDGLTERYGLRIPVLRRDDGRELDWPFDVQDVMRFLALQ